MLRCQLNGVALRRCLAGRGRPLAQMAAGLAIAGLMVTGRPAVAQMPPPAGGTTFNPEAPPFPVAGAPCPPATQPAAGIPAAAVPRVFITSAAGWPPEPGSTTPAALVFNVFIGTEFGTMPTAGQTYPQICIMPGSKPIQIGYTTTDASAANAAPFAPAQAGVDYVPVSGTLTFNPGDPGPKQIVVPILPRMGFSPNKLFEVLLTNPVNVILTNPFAFGKITNHTPPPQTRNDTHVDEFSMGFTGHGGGLLLASDKNFWTTEQYDAKLGSFNTQTLTATEYPLPSATNRNPDIFPHFIIEQPDKLGTLWFTDLHDRIGSFDLATKTATMYPVTPHSVPHLILYDPVDHNLYFSEQAEENDPLPGGVNKTYSNQGRIARFNPTTHQLKEYFGLLPIGNRIHGMVLDPRGDGNIWAGLEGTDEIVRFNIKTESFDRDYHFSPGSGPHDLLAGPDGNIYVVLQDVNHLGQFNPATGEIHEYPTTLTPEDGNSLVFLTVGPDNQSMWFSEFLNDRVGRFDLITHKITEFHNGISMNAAPIGIAVGPDGNIWFSEPNLDVSPGKTGHMGRLIPPSPTQQAPNNAFGYIQVSNPFQTGH